MRFLLNILETAIMIFFVAALTIGLTELMLARGLDPFLIRLAALLLIVILVINGIRRAFSRPRTIRVTDQAEEVEPNRSAYMGLVAGFLFLMSIAAQIRKKLADRRNESASST